MEVLKSENTLTATNADVIEEKKKEGPKQRAQRPPMKLTFRQKLMKAFRLSMIKKKAFIGTYVDNRRNLQKFYLERNIILVAVDHGKERIHKYSFRMEDTKAQQKEKRLVLHYVEDNFFMRQIGFKNNITELIQYGLTN